MIWYYLNTKLKYCLTLWCFLSLTACHIARIVPEGEQLLVSNKIDRGDIHGVDLSDEEKKQVYKASRKELVKTLNGRFDSEKTKAILAAVKEIRNK